MRARIDQAGRRRLTTVATSALLLATMAGCTSSDGEAATPAFVPGWAEARQAVESSLSAWRDAPSPAQVSFDIEGVRFVDKTRKIDQRLMSFKVLGQTDIENARQFTVRLNLEGEEVPQLVKYNVLGRDPVWVFRLDDYENFAHWEHEMTTPEPGSSEQPKTTGEPARAN
jgi:hypothetical protein